LSGLPDLANKKKEDEGRDSMPEKPNIPGRKLENEDRLGDLDNRGEGGGSDEIHLSITTQCSLERENEARGRCHWEKKKPNL